MRLLLIISIFFIGAAHSAKANVCEKFIRCGTYEGHGANYDANFKPIEGSHLIEKIVIDAEGENVARVQESIYVPGQEKAIYSFDLRFEFQNNGQYNAISAHSEVSATGICRHFVCTFSFFPTANGSKAYGNVNILRFERDQLQRTMMLSSGIGERKFQESQLSKQKNK